jgi:hypothetical protein
VPLSEERLAQIKDLSTYDRSDRVVDWLSLSDADKVRFLAELDADRTAFCRHNSNPEELHAFAVTWMWDDTTDALQHILDNPVCEAATALLIYWRANPEWYLQFADRDAVLAAYGARSGELEIFDFVSRLETRYVAGEFLVGSLAFDPSRPGSPFGYSFVGAYDNLRHGFVRALPAAMYAPVGPTS